MPVVTQNVVSNYKCKSGEKVEFDTLHFIDGSGFVLYIGGLRIFFKRHKKKKTDVEDTALVPLGPILKKERCASKKVCFY